MAENNDRNQNEANMNGNDISEAVGTVGGGVAGAAVGSLFGPLGTVAGAIAGGALGNQAGEGVESTTDNAKNEQDAD
ncbi:glycine zipper 2TM domain-containing protein [Aneurinibacillus uraniidurans]|uniref:glycine zipper 2TM domain-containing protein n=1 Tax=Aneurinibacillus uraniidurans TaxID=2966586 RepID=UPI00234BCD69|nr:glycine zipper 2TM domain-containing protein [Aneurinibacillus sp. B1]WCN36766.1 glycine zipper 2TM domain-containing protein [Aneurinibacillus sp. B1]